MDCLRKVDANGEVLNERKAEKKDGGCVEVHLMPGAVLDREKCEKCATPASVSRERWWML